MLADEHGVETSGTERRSIIRAPDPALGHPHDRGRNRPTDPDSPCLINLERVQVALVHTDQVGADGDRPRQLVLVMDLDQRVEADLTAQPVKLRQILVIEHRSDEQHAVGAHKTGVEDVGIADGEVFPDHRNPGDRSRRLEIGDRSAEVRFVGEHRQACRPAGLVGRGDARRVERHVQITLRRASPFDFRDHR